MFLIVRLEHYFVQLRKIFSIYLLVDDVKPTLETLGNDVCMLLNGFARYFLEEIDMWIMFTGNVFQTRKCYCMEVVGRWLWWFCVLFRLLKHFG